METSTHILVVVDDHAIRTRLGRYLQGQGFRVSLAQDGRHADETIASQQIDLVVLALMLPDIPGLDLCRNLRARSQILIILLTVRKDDVDRIIGLEIGADDYLGKPFNPRELLARVRAVLRRTTSRPVVVDTQLQSIDGGGGYCFAGFTAMPSTRELVDAEGSNIRLTGAELDLLVAFLERPGRMLSRDQLLDITQGRNASPFDRSMCLSAGCGASSAMPEVSAS